MADLLSKALAAFSGCKVVVVGDVILDAYIYGETVRVSREAPVLVVRKESREHRLGGAANTAINLVELGAKVELLTTVGADEGGEVLRGMLTDAGVGTGAIVEVGTSTPVKTRILAGAVGTTKQQVLRLDDEPTALDGVVSRQLADVVRAQASDADAIVISDYGLGTVGDEVIEVAREFASQGRIVCVDSRYGLDRFEGVTAVTPNQPEAEAVLGFRIDSADDIERAGTQLRTELGCQAVLLTLGRRGMTLFGDGPSSHVDIVGEEEVTDVTGAGDTVMAAFSLSLAAGLGMENGMRLANCAAGVVVTKTGAATCSPDELERAARGAAMELVAWGE